MDGGLKLRYCTTILAKQFQPWVLPRFGGEVGKRRAVTSGDLLDIRGNSGKRVLLARKTCPGIPVRGDPDPGHPTPRRWKRLLHLLAPQDQERGGRASQSFSSSKGWVNFCVGVSQEPASEGSRLEGRVPAGQPSPRGWCTGTSP